jgi:hypothetical protein
LKKGDLGGLSVIVRSYSTRHANISTYAVFLLSLRNLPLSAWGERRVHEFSPPLIGSTIRQAHGAERSRSTSSLQVGGGEGEGNYVNLIRLLQFCFSKGI